jgi:hypothetical protein
MEHLKIRIKRVARSEGHVSHRMDERFVNASIVFGPVPGESFVVLMDRLGEDWVTSKVTKVIRRGDGSTMIHTKNSMYLTVGGWDEEN